MDITVGNQQAAPARRHRRVPWSPRAWIDAFYLAAGIPVQLVGALVVFALVLWTFSRDSGSVTVRLWLPLLAAAAMIAWVSPALTRVQRHRLRVTAGVDIPPQPKRGRLTWNGFVAEARSQSTWRQLGYHVLIAPVLAVAAAVAVLLWPAAVAFIVAACAVFQGRPQSAPATGAFSSPGSQPLHHPVGIILIAAGAVALFAAPWVGSGVRALDIRAARGLLGPSRADELASRVEQLTETRAGVVDAADAERRRLERDLHDGTQQRLVSLAMNLGMARAQAGSEDEAKRAIAEAHEEAKAALAELRDLIRGLHPAVLEDRGLDAALSGVAARMPVPVRLTVDLPRRPAPVIEAVAYFVVSEGLANIAKHSQASEAAVFVQRAGDRLHVIVTDDGVGGADAAGGTGLAGLARRAASVDGTFEIDSPPGGPTLLTVDLPCNR
jgi:signal transduction histidine kinase